MHPADMFNAGQNFAPALPNYSQNESTGGQQQQPTQPPETTLPQDAPLFTGYPQDMNAYGYNPMFYQWYQQTQQQQQQQQMMMGLYQNAFPSPSTTQMPATYDENLVRRKTYPQQLADKDDRQKNFDEVSGRLCLLNQSTKYKVTVGEICRRMNAPETLHASLINGILRNAKAKDNATKLRCRLQNFNLELPQGRRKTCAPTGFTAFCEQEAAGLARDLGLLLDTEGGANDIAIHLREQYAGCDFEKEMSIFKKWVSSIVAIHPEDADPDDISPTNVAEQAMHHLSLLTHGYSHRAIPLALRFAMTIGDKIVRPEENASRRASTSAFPSAPGGNPMMFPMNAPSVAPFGDITNAFSNPYCSPAMYAWQQQQQQLMGAMTNPNGFDFNNLMQNTSQENRSQPEKFESKMYTPLLENLHDRVQKFDEVSGRLLLLSQSQKYTVSTGEICRRMAAPETLHTSLINGILRNAKARDNGTKLRTKLANFSIELPQGRRKTCNPTKYTALCETEAGKLARDFERLILDEKHGGSPEIGEHLATMANKIGDDVRREIEIVKKWLQCLIQLHPRQKSPEEIEPKNIAERAINHLSLMTHGFSHIAIPAVFEFAVKILDHIQQVESARSSLASQAQASMPMTMPMMGAFLSSMNGRN